MTRTSGATRSKVPQTIRTKMSSMVLVAQALFLWGCSDGSCTRGGVTYEDGESWKCDCNYCQCNDGSVVSTAIACDSGDLGGAGGFGPGGAGGVGPGGAGGLAGSASVVGASGAGE